MVAHDGGGTFASGWYGKTVPTMWAALKDFDDTPHWTMVGAWRKSYELIITHISQVKQYRENLATAWPPHKSKAAAAYVQELDVLIKNLEETYDAAIANHTALSTATQAINAARRELEPIQQEHTANAGLLAEYNAQNQTTSSSSGSTPTPTPSPSPSPQVPPVAPGRQIELQTKAAGIMQSLSAELATAQTSFVAPRPYVGTSSQDTSGSEIPSGSGSVGGSGSGRNPGFSPRGTTPIGTGDVSTPKTTDRTTPDTGVTGPDDRTPAQGPTQGPTLVGTNPTTPTVTTPGPSTPTGPGTGTGTLPPGGTPVGGSFPFTPSTGGSGAGGGTGGRYTPVGAGGLPTGISGVRGGTAGHGGVIGGSPAGGGGMPGGRAGQLGSGMPGGVGGPAGSGGRGGQAGSGMRGGAGRINPAGGMIGGSGANGRAGNGMGQGGMGAPLGRRGNGRTEEDPNNRRWDPDNPWETNDGVDPVLLPAQEHRIDPGPTIGGR
ncbi:MAG TPA: hypothetical protein VN408_12780 [Actinoplanes sp.]|nr:hypothetical protein [Actinoplanes sp.]